ncbi:lysine-specific demethylase 2B-like isoform X2 [Sycon ciliatum]|uniref:lysine-specific demethylase 2B-like isoform X2 n=1 Tax=Sycon ciliatum TaxID=27933 RepID=UPI0031F66486
MMDEGDDGLNLAARILIFAWPATSVSQIHKGCHRHSWRKKGWIHAVHTPVDSLVFGGNFLHSFNISGQLAVADIEETTKVPQKFRFPFFTQLMWYALDKYAHSLRYYLEQFHGYKPDDSTTITPTGTIVMDTIVMDAIDTVDNTIDIAMDTTIDTAMDTSTSGKEKEESDTSHTATTTADATEPSDAKCETESVATPEPPVADATPAKSTRVEKAHVSDRPSSPSPRMRRRKAAIAAAAAISILYLAGISSRDDHI